jgi:hypothetical protein
LPPPAPLAWSCTACDAPPAAVAAVAWAIALADVIRTLFSGGA